MASFTRNTAILKIGDERIVYKRDREAVADEGDLNDSPIIHVDHRGNEPENPDDEQANRGDEHVNSEFSDN